MALPVQRSAQREILAKFTVWALPALLCMVGASGFIVYQWIDVVNAALLSRPYYPGNGLIYVTILLIVFIPILYAGIRQVLFDGRRAIWVQDGDVIYLDRRYFCVACANIAAMTMAYNNRNQEGIEMTLKDGTKKFLLTGGLTVDGDDVLTSLKRICFG